MGDLLDQVLQNKDNPTADQLLSPVDDKPHTLDDGGVVYDSTIAAIYRILRLNPHLHKRETGKASEPYQLYNRHVPVDLTDRKTLLSLLKADWVPTTPWQTTFLVNKLTELAPLLSRRHILVSEGLIWDGEQGRLRTLTEDDKIRIAS